MVYYASTGHAVNDGGLHIRFSDNYGETWSAEDTALDGNPVVGFPMNPPDCNPGEDANEPYLMIAPNGDLLLHMWRADTGISFNGTYQSRSVDGGATWDVPAAIAVPGADDITKLFTTDDHFVYNNIIYLGARQFGDIFPTIMKNIFLKSEDSGVSWSLVSDITASGTSEVGLEYIGNSTIIALLRNAAVDKTLRTYSTDMGATWQATEDITDQIPAGGRHRIQTRAHLEGQANWWQDTILIANGFIKQAANRGNMIMVSLDSGDTWKPFYVDIETSDAGYGDMFYNPTTGQYILMAYHGTSTDADIKQYNVTITGL